MQILSKRTRAFIYQPASSKTFGRNIYEIPAPSESKQDVTEKFYTLVLPLTTESSSLLGFHI